MPERLRAPIVLCYLQGLTYDAAADRLGLSAIAIRGRLARAREQLRRRLIRRGVTVPAALLVAGATGRAEAAIPVTLIEAAIHVALRSVTGNTATLLARGVLNSMLLSQLGVAMIALCLVIGSSYWAWHTFAEDGPPNPGPVAVKTPVSTDVSGVADPEPTQAVQEQEAQEQKTQSAARLKFMKETAARLEIRVKGNGGAKLELGTEPVMRWDSVRSRVVDASAFVWFDEHRPQAIGGIWIKDGHATFELQSLSAGPLTAAVDGTPRSRWSTERPGISWEAVEGAPRPAASRGERLRQMKQLAKDFSVHAVKTPPDYHEGSLWHLRMLVQPIHRYAEDAAVDGAIFAFAQGTDPEAFLILESRPANGTNRWHFGMASACIWELHARRGAREVWSRPMGNPQDADTIYGLVGPFAVDPKLFPPDLIKSQPAP